MPPANDFAKQTRAFLKLQDGCDAYCTYCIIPKIRKNVCSITPKKALQHAKILIEAGHPEIVLTGIYLGAYGRNTTRRKKWQDTEKSPLTDFIEKLAKLKDLQRIRLSSLEPGDINEKMLQTLKNYPKLMPHLHLPLQSGSDNILKKMARQYRSSDFRQVIEKTRKTLDRPAITTDIIVGFPGETDQDFAQTLEMAEFAQFSKIHIFPFSPRQGTAAARMKPPVKPQIVKKRTEKLAQLSEKLTKNYIKQFVGEKISIIIENEKKQIGRSERYFEVKITPNAPRQYKKGQLVSGTLKKDRDSFYLIPDK
jgi:threonylcarbamoyladenosine tRNA methylthiotransferase MtaB